MTKRERVRSVIQGKKPDSVPVGFWYHFPESAGNGPAAVKAHVNYLRDTDVDLLKIMNENLYRIDSPPANASEWRNVTPASLTAPFYRQQLEIVRRVLDEVHDSVYTLVTIHGVFASAFHAFGLTDDRFTRDNPVEAHLADDPGSVAAGLQGIAESLAGFALECVGAGVDGIYYAALGGERWRKYSDSAFEQAIKTADCSCLDRLARADADLFVHICKPDVNFSLYSDYPGDVFNWATHANDLSLSEGHELFGRPILGGFDDRSGTLVDGSTEEIASVARSIAADHSDIPFMLGADCTLPTNLESWRIRAAVMAMRE